MNQKHIETFRTQKFVSAVSLVVASITFAVPAHAQHFIEEVFGAVDPNGAKTAGRLLDGFGKKVEQMGSTALRDAGVWRGGWEVKSEGGAGSTSHGSYQPQVSHPAPIAYGNFCQTQFAGRMPGPFMPVGSACHFYTPYGPVVGWVSQ